MDNAPIFFEGSAVVTNVIKTGAAFAVSNNGDVYIPYKVARAYNLQRGDHITISARKNFRAYEDHAPYVLIDIKDANPPSSAMVTDHVEYDPVIDDALTPLWELERSELREAVFSMLDNNSMCCIEDFLNDYYDEEAVERDDDRSYNTLVGYLEELVDDKQLWAMRIYQGDPEDEITHAIYYGLNPHKMGKATY